MSKEYRLHLAVIAHINSAFIGPHNPNLKFWHVPNQTRNATEAFFNKQMGVLPGVSDLCFGWPGHAGVLELKAADGKLTAAQNRFLSWAYLVGWRHGTARTVKGAHNVLCSWGLKPLHSTCREPDLRTIEDKHKDAYNFYARPDHE